MSLLSAQCLRYLLIFLKGANGIGMLTPNSEFALAQQDLFDRALFEVLQDDTVWQMVHDMGNIRGNAYVVISHVIFL